MPEFKVYLEDILESARRIENYVRGLSFEDFSVNMMAIDAVIRNLEIIGEAVKHLPEDIKKSHPEIEWKRIAGLRDILIHEYFGVDLRIIWDIVTEKVPELKLSVEKIAAEIE